MKPPARVTSLDLLRDFRAALATFKADGQDALTAIALDVRRAFDWLAHQRAFWVRSVRECQDEVTQAKAELARKQVMLPGERQPDTTQEEKALRRAQARLAHAEEQVERCRRWEPALRRAADEYEGPARQLADLLEADVPKAVGLMDRLVAALEEYLAVAKPLPAQEP
jgi:chromosome segregation ATPase